MIRSSWRVLVLLVLLGAVACSDDGVGPGDETPAGETPIATGPSGLVGEWPTVAANLERTSFNQYETLLTKETVGSLVAKWHFPTEGPVAASPVVATVDVPDEGPVRIVVVGSYDGNVYAIRATDGSELWRFTVKPHPGVSYGLIVSSASIAPVGGIDRVYVAGGETMYALNAATGELLWEFDAGTGCTTCDPRVERNEILSSPAVVPERDLVLFGMDVNENAPGKGGFYALSAEDGRLRWYFDVDTGAVCRPDDDDDVRRFDGFHSAEQLGLPEDFYSTREGCDFDRTETACGNVWSPVSVDLERELLYFASSNCKTDDDPSTPDPSPPMSRYNEALVALELDGTPSWSWRPREIDNADLAFGAAPNLFVTTIEGEEREVVGVGNKDGTYYLLDRDGVNDITGEVGPYWQTNVVAGGAIGGITGTAAVGEGMVFFGTGIGKSIEEFQRPSAWALRADDGEVLWSEDAAPFYGPTSAVPGVVFMGGVDNRLRGFDADTGEILVSLRLGELAFSQAVIVDGEVFVGSGFGAQSATSIEEAAERGLRRAGVWAFCIAGAPGCETERLYAPQDNRLDIYDIVNGRVTGQVTVLIPADRNTVNGQACLLPDGSGNFLMGEDTGQPDIRVGWGVFSPDGTLVQKIEEPVSPGEAEQPDPFGCGFDSEGRLFVTDVGTGNFGFSDGKLIVFFPPEYETYCLLDTTLRTAGTIAIAEDGSVYITETVPPGKVLRFSPPFATGSDECDTVPPNRSTFIDGGPALQTPFGIVQAPNGNWYVSSVLLPEPMINEYDSDGNFVRTIVAGGTGGTPAGLALGSDGTLYYADLAIVERPPGSAVPFGPAAGEGTVRRVTFDENGEPSLPEIIASGLSFPDAVSVLPLP